jgi:hypothetical protein
MKTNKGTEMSAYQQKVVIGDAVLYQADCAELLPTLAV